MRRRADGTIGRVSEGLSATEVGKEIGEHAKLRAGVGRLDRAIAIGEASSSRSYDRRRVVGLVGGSGEPSRRSRSRRPRPPCGRRRTGRSRSRDLPRGETRPRSTPWFDAYLATTRRRSRSPSGASGRVPGRVRRLDRHGSVREPTLRPGPQAMPEYVPTGLADSRELDDEADELFAEGARGRGDRRQLRAHHGHPRERALPRRDQHAAPAARPCATGSSPWDGPAGLRRRP